MKRPRLALASAVAGIVVIAALTFVAGLLVGMGVGERRIVARLDLDTRAALRMPSTSELAHAAGMPSSLRVPGVSSGTPRVQIGVGGGTAGDEAGDTPGEPIAADTAATSAAETNDAEAAAADATMPAEDAQADAGESAASSTPPAVTVLPAMRLASLRAEMEAKAIEAGTDDAGGDGENGGGARAEAERPSPAESLATSLVAARAPSAAPDGPAYAVELSMFRELESARRMRSDLVARGHAAAIVMEQPEGDRPWYVVTHGRFAARSSAEQAAYRLWREEGLHGDVVLVLPAETEGDE